MRALPEIRTVLYCTQLGPNAAYVFRYAYLMAEKVRAQITVLHVVATPNPRLAALVDGYAGAGALGAVTERQEREALVRLEERVRTFCTRVVGEADGGPYVERIAVAGGRSPSEGIVEQVEEAGADLVVMGAHAESSLLGALVGGTAQKVVHACPVPVLLVQVPEGQQDLTMADG